MSSDSAYECFRPFTIAKLSEAHCKFNYGYLQMKFVFDGEDSDIHVYVDTGDEYSRHAFWKVVASVTIDTPQKKGALTTDMCCSSSSFAYHNFDASSVNPMEEMSATIVFKEIVGFGVVPRPWDYFKSSSLTDICLLVDGQRFYQDKKILAYHSPFFRTLFFGDFAEKHKDEIQIEDVTPARFTDLMDALHESHGFNSTNIYTVLEDADRFNFSVIIRSAEDYLLSKAVQSIPVFKKLILSDKYRMARLQAHLISTWDKNNAYAVTLHRVSEELSSDTLRVVLAATRQFL